VAKPKIIELNNGKVLIPILYEDRSVLAVDKPAGWMLAPDSWDKTGRNLQLALQSSLNAGDFWAHSRNIKFLRYVHRLDAETTGVLLLCKSLGALKAYSELFETRSVEKYYLAVVEGVPEKSEWTSRLPLIADPAIKGKMQVVRPGKPSPGRAARGAQAETKDAETHFRVIQTLNDKALVEARPLTGRTHQIRVHLAASGFPIVGDPLYGNAPAAASKGAQVIALRAVRLLYRDPFQKRQIRIDAPTDEFLKTYGFELKKGAATSHERTPVTEREGTTKPSDVS
jgi:RluA family pseudouridine synthase